MQNHRVLPVEWMLAAAAGAAAFAACFAAGIDWRLSAAALTLTAGMAVIALVDRREFIIPDAVSLPLMPLGLIFSGSLVHPDALVLIEPENLIGVMVSPIALYLIGLAYRRARGRQGIGMGDVKLIAVAGSWVGISRVPLVVLIAATFALGVALFEARTARGRTAPLLHSAMPFGLYLAPAILIVWIIYDVILLD